MTKSKHRKRVWFHRSRGIAWGIIGALSFPLGFANNIAIVWLASVYANALTDWGAGEASDNREVLDKIDELKKFIEDNRCTCRDEIKDQDN